jgi:hypothetical protein
MRIHIVKSALNSLNQTDFAGWPFTELLHYIGEWAALILVADYITYFVVEGIMHHLLGLGANASAGEQDDFTVDERIYQFRWSVKRGFAFADRAETRR